MGSETLRAEIEAHGVLSNILSLNDGPSWFVSTIPSYRVLRMQRFCANKRASFHFDSGVNCAV